jgi:hypothetical protein
MREPLRIKMPVREEESSNFGIRRVAPQEREARPKIVGTFQAGIVEVDVAGTKVLSVQLVVPADRVESCAS